MAKPINTIIVIIILLSSSCIFDADVGNLVVPDQHVSDRFEQSLRWNAQNSNRILNVDEENYQLYVAGDSHVGGISNLTSMYKIAEANNALGAMLAGDITTGYAEDIISVDSLVSEFSGINTFGVVGNHDLYFNGWSAFYQTFGSSSYYFTVVTPSASDIYFCLDTGSGTLGAEQLKWFEDTLEAERLTHRNCIVVTHNNIFRLRRTFSTNPYVEEIRYLLDLFDRYSVTAVLTGHDHKSDAQLFGNTQHIILDALSDKNSDAGYLVLSIDSDGVVYQFEKID